MPSQPPDTIARLWSYAHAMFARMRAAVGEAAAIALQPLEPAQRRAIAAWLRPLEAMVRKIVLIEAVALARAGAPLNAGARRPSPRAASARPPAVTLVPIAPAPIHVSIAAAPPAPAPRPRAASLRLWPRRPASAGPRVRDLGTPLLAREAWRDRARLALARHLARVRSMRRPPQARIARRIEALARLLDKPLAAARRLARKLRAVPRLALDLALAALPRAGRYGDPAYAQSGHIAYDRACALIDTS